MKDYNTRKTFSVLRKNAFSIILKMSVAAAGLLLIGFFENIITLSVEKQYLKTLIFTVFWSIRIFLYIPLMSGILKSIYFCNKEKIFWLYCFESFNNYFGVVFSAIFTVVSLLFKSCFIYLFYAMIIEIYGRNFWTDILFVTSFVIMLYLELLRIIKAMIDAFEGTENTTFKNYMHSYSNDGIIKVLRYLKPCLNRLLLILFVFPLVYVVPFTLVRMSVREEKTDVN